jgi:hypothetical protein
LVLADEKQTLPPVMRFLVSRGGDIQRCYARNLSLEEAFVHLVEGEK